MQWGPCHASTKWASTKHPHGPRCGSTRSNKPALLLCVSAATKGRQPLAALADSRMPQPAKAKVLFLARNNSE